MALGSWLWTLRYHFETGSLPPLLLLSLVWFGALRAGLDSTITEPLEVIRVYAEEGDPSAQFHLALFYTNGEGVKKDPVEAVRWYRKAAAGGSPEAQYNFGVLLSAGVGVPRDDREAVHWFRAAAAQGLFEAQRALIRACAHGTGTPQNMGEALKWDFLARRTLELRFELPAGHPPKPATLREDGFAEYETAEGKREALGPNGIVEQIGADGTRTLKLPNGTVKAVTADGLRRTRHSDGGAVTEFPNGMRITRNPDGSIETVLPDGTKTLETAAKTEHGEAARSTVTFDKDGRRLSEEVHRTTRGRAVAVFVPDEPLVTVQPPVEPATAAKPAAPTRAETNIFREKVEIDKQLAELARLEKEVRYFAGATQAEYESGQAEAREFVIELGAVPQRAVKSTGASKARSTPLPSPPAPAPLHPLATDRSDAYPFGYYGRLAIKAQPWKHAETSHFVVHYVDNANATTAMRFIECAYFVVTETLRIDTQLSPRKMHVFIFPDAATWEAFKLKNELPPQVRGFAYKDELLLGAEEEGDAYIKLLCHESTHAIVAHFYPGRKWPLWLNEGFAEYMGAKSIAVSRNQPVAKYLSKNGAGPIEAGELFYRVRYGPPPSVRSLPNGTLLGDPGPLRFYAQSERCISVLLEKLPARAFPPFANLVLAGNSLPVSLGTAYGERFFEPAAFQELLNAP